MKIFAVSIIILLLIVFSGCHHGYDELTIEKQAHKMIIAGFNGTSFGHDPVIIDHIKKGLGGVILFDADVATGSANRNIQSTWQLQRLIANFQAASPQGLIVAIDQEGGRVCRLKSERGFYCPPAAKTLGDMNNHTKTERAAAENAIQLKELGINLNFAPVVDLNTNPQNPVIGAINRSFSDNPNAVIRNSRAFIQSHKDYGVGCCIKHFPGHGSSSGDSHKGFVDVSDTWDSLELEPYKELISEGCVDAVMTAHVFNSNLDPKYPATLSKRIITGLLRKELGFDGVIFSDDMQMGAIADNYGFDLSIVQAINSGVDMLILANNSPKHNDSMIVQRAVDVITQAVKDGRISPRRLAQSCKRIDDFRAKLR